MAADTAPVAELHRQVARGAILGAVGAAAALAFVAAVSAGDDLLWSDTIDPDWFGGSIRIPVIMTTAGLLVGLIHRYVPTSGEENVFVALATGSLDRTAVPGGVAIALVTLIGGFSLGPEVPTGMAAAGIAAWWSTRRKVPPEEAESEMRAAITGAWGGLFTAPFTAVLLNVELNFERRVISWTRLAGDATAAIVGFVVFFAVTASWSDVLRLLDLPTYSLEVWQLALAAGLGIIGALVGTLFKLSMLATRRLAAPLADQPVIRCTLAGAVLGLMGVALPLTLFLGTDGLVDATTEPETLGTGLILATVAAKVLATTGALSFGFVGGPVFPLLFVGGGLGSVVHLISADVPLALAVTTLMAAVPASVIPVPFSLATLTVLVSGVGGAEASAVFVAAVVALVTGRMIESSIAAKADARG